ncbi:DUF5980 family protein [Streptomyces sp. NPDC057245]|uniref:DUF5980 family protein n=1 Tax=Streptomyces TaxID=1883 RepID=UPI001C1DF2EA|nr:DUF5980 family protein [Streptomyces sp. A108]MBU6534616.1 hypothetical protein [Streptomyces sp. A108]
MKKSCRKAGLLVGLASVIALPLVGAAPASAAPTAAAPPDSATTSATWSLLQGHNQYCARPNRVTRTYAIGAVEGTWSSPITAGLRNLPPGSTSDGVATLAPGTNERDPDDGGLAINIWLQLSIAPAPPGTYSAEVYATDGKVTDTAPVTIKISADC